MNVKAEAGKACRRHAARQLRQRPYCQSRYVGLKAIVQWRFGTDIMALLEEQG
jgi:hypothetical protein